MSEAKVEDVKVSIVSEIEDVETRIYNMIQNEKNMETPLENPTLFVLINSAEINILENNCLKINNITFHYYGSYNSYENRKVIEYYRKKNYAGNIYLLGTGPLYNFEISEHKPKIESQVGQIFIESTFNSLKYISKYNNEITLMQYSKDEQQQKSYIKKTHSNNKKFVDLLKNNYKNSLFYCPRDLGIVGVEGYSRFYNEFYKYLDTVNKIYLIKIGRAHV